jgi:hypothetical protein
MPCEVCEKRRAAKVEGEERNIEESSKTAGNEVDNAMGSRKMLQASK